MMRAVFLVVATLSIIFGFLFLIMTGTDVGKLCSIIVIQIGFVLIALADIRRNTEANSKGIEKLV